MSSATAIPNQPGPAGRGWRPALGALVVGLCLTFMAASFVREWETRDRQHRAAQAAAEHVEALQGQIIRSIEVLYAIEALFSTREEIDAAEFRAFVTSTLQRRPEIQGLAWDPRVPESDRDAWEGRTGPDGAARFSVVEQRGDGVLVPASPRPEYFPVQFMENVTGNEVALGFDLASEARRRRALEAARDTGQPAATPPLRLVQETGSQLGFLVLLPVYAGQPATPAERRSATRGVAVAVYRAGDLVNRSLLPAFERGIGLRIVDTGAQQLVYERSAAMRGVPWTTSIDVAGRPWQLQFTLPAASASPAPWQAWASIAGGTAITLLLSAYLWSHGRRLIATERRVREATAHLSAEIGERRRAERALRAAHEDLEARVQQRTDELAASNDALRTEVEVRQLAEARADAANRAKSTFLANMSHEIRTPLNAILGYAQILERYEGPVPFQDEAVATIAASSQHLLHLVNEVLDLSKIDAGRMELASSELNLASLAHELRVMFHPLCEEKRLELRIDAPRAPVTVTGDAGKLRQVLINLLGNAVKFTDTGHVTLRLTPEPEDGWRFDVEDTGPGIPPPLADVIFEPFQQSDAGARCGGTGLGLAIACRHVELMGGRLHLEAGGAGGTRFHFSLILPPAAGGPVDGVPTRWRLAPGTSLNALVVDDVAENRAVLSRLLQLVGCDTTVAATGEDALRALEHSQVDVVFMDLRLPGMDGLDATRRMAAARAGHRPRLVATSASVLDGERERARRGGCDAFLSKPVHADQLHALLAALPGVELVTCDAPGPAGGSAAETRITVDLPRALAERMTRAADQHSATALRACLIELEQLGAGGRRLAGDLRVLLTRYDMEAIQEVLAHLPAASPTGISA